MCWPILSLFQTSINVGRSNREFLSVAILATHLIYKESCRKMDSQCGINFVSEDKNYFENYGTVCEKVSFFR